jgi:hypothetical protein
MIKVLSSSGILFGQGEMPTMVGASSESGFFRSSLQSTLQLCEDSNSEDAT